MERRMDGWMDRQMSRWTYGERNGWMDRQVDGRMDIWTEETQPT